MAVAAPDDAYPLDGGEGDIGERLCWDVFVRNNYVRRRASRRRGGRPRLKRHR
jgi:hypothetical protein